MPVSLPIDAFLPSLWQHLNKDGFCVVVAEPGAGKTTRVAPFISKQLKSAGQILLIQPRRIAAIAAAQRIAEEEKQILGNWVGYAVRFEQNYSDQSKILVATDGWVLKRMQQDPLLKNISCIIFDEFHERSLNMDLLLGLCYELKNLERPDLLITCMSATLDAEKLCQYLNKAACVQVPGRMFATQVHYQKKPMLLNTGDDFIKKVCDSIGEALKNTELQKGEHVLVFLPGSQEIQKIKTKLEKQLTDGGPRFKVYALYGRSSLAEQKEAIGELWQTQGFWHKIILATNIAETSLTVPGVKIVIDSGLKRELVWDQKKMYPSLNLSRLSRASSEQRRGRAGRVGPGICYRLWHVIDEKTMPDFDEAEILSAPLDEALLLIANFGITQAQDFSWFEKPDSQKIEKALQNLKSLGLINQENRITELGQNVVALPLDLNLALFVLKAKELKIGFLATLAAGLLSLDKIHLPENFIEYEAVARGCDLTALLLYFFTKEGESMSFDGTFDKRKPDKEKALKIALNLRQFLKIPNEYQPFKTDSFLTLQRATSFAFKSFICKKRKTSDSYLSYEGKGAELAKNSLPFDGDFLVALKGRSLSDKENSVIEIKVPIKKEWLMADFANELVEKSELLFDEEKLRFKKVNTSLLGRIPIREDISQDFLSDELLPELVELAIKNLDLWKRKNADFKRHLDRLAFWNQLTREEDDKVHIELVLEQIFEMVLYGEKGLQVLLNKESWENEFKLALGTLDYKKIDSELPLFIMAEATKRRLVIDYDSASSSAQVSLKIQDAFGWPETPRIFYNKIPLKMVLLAPNMRPLQTTQDLKSFWQNTYPELKGPLQARYPKHKW